MVLMSHTCWGVWHRYSTTWPGARVHRATELRVLTVLAFHAALIVLVVGLLRDAAETNSLATGWFGPRTVRPYGPTDLASHLEL